MAVRLLSALRAGHTLHPGGFLVVISVRGSIDSKAILLLEGLIKLNYFIGNGTHDLPAVSTLPQ
jgi:hypothetical protein